MEKMAIITALLSTQASALQNQPTTHQFDATNTPHNYLFHYEIGSSLDASKSLLDALGVDKPGKRKSVVKITVSDESGARINHEQINLDIDATNTFWQEKIHKVVKMVDQQGQVAYYTSLRANQGETVYFLVAADIGETELTGRFQHRFNLQQP